MTTSTMDEPTVLEGPVSSLYSPAQQATTRFRESIRALADGRHVVIVADANRGPDGLLSTLRAMSSLRGVGRASPPPTLLIDDPPFDEDDEIRVPVEETHLENVFVTSGSLEVNP